jgi:hypothetical protein
MLVAWKKEQDRQRPQAGAELKYIHRMLQEYLKEHYIVENRRLIAELVELHAKLRNELEELCGLVKQALQLGFVKFHLRMDYKKLFGELKAGDTLLWFDTYHPNPLEFLDELNQAVDRGACLRMLILNPDSVLVKYRARELQKHNKASFDLSSVRQDIIAFRTSVEEAFARNPTSNSKALYYDSLPGSPIYIVVRNKVPIRVFTGYYFLEPSILSIHLQWKYEPRGPVDALLRYVNYKLAEAERHERKVA